MTTPESALSAAVTAIDAARRAGWAKAYAAEKTADELARDYNVLATDLALLTRYVGVLQGLMETVCPAAIDILQGNPGVSAMSRSCSDYVGIRPHEIRSYLPEAGLAEGRRIGRLIRRRRKQRRELFLEQGQLRRLVHDKY